MKLLWILVSGLLGTKSVTYKKGLRLLFKNRLGRRKFILRSFSRMLVLFIEENTVQWATKVMTRASMYFLWKQGS